MSREPGPVAVLQMLENREVRSPGCGTSNAREPGDQICDVISTPRISRYVPSLHFKMARETQACFSVGERFKVFYQ